jgi:hypothetical protein
MPMTSTYVDLQKYIATDSLQFDDWFDDLYTCFNDSLQGSRIEGKIIFTPDTTIHTISVLVYPGSVKGAHKTFLELQDYYKNYLGAWLDDTDYEEPGIKSCIWKKYNFSLFLREEWSMSYVNIYRRK